MGIGKLPRRAAENRIKLIPRETLAASCGV